MVGGRFIGRWNKTGGCVGPGIYFGRLGRDLDCKHRAKHLLVNRCVIGRRYNTGSGQ
jgi:hypothetical protein